MATAGLPLWSTTAASNSTADPAVGMAEGMAPSAVNDGIRALMASVAKYRDDLWGSTAGLTTGGTSTAYTVTTNSTFATAAAMSGAMFTFIPHTTSGAAPTLAVDGLTARAINMSTGVAVPTGSLVAGTPYLVKYVHATTEFILVGGTNEAITNARLSTMVANTLKGRATASTGAPEDVTLGAGLAMSGGALVLSGTTQPQGRLTLTSATPVLASDTASQSTIYYTPYVGNLIPLYDGTNFNLTSFSELSMVMSGANFAASAIYDLFVALDSGTMRLAIGPAWATATAGSGARGTGAGTTELERKNGIWTNKLSITLRYASGSTFTAAANTALYVGSLQMDGTNSQVTCHQSFGQSRKWGLWNAYNRVPIILQAGDSTASWAYTTNAFRASNNDANNKLSVFTGLPEETADIVFEQIGTITNNNTTSQMEIGIGQNSTSTTSGKLGYFYNSTGIAGAVTVKSDMIAEYLLAPTIGVNNMQCIENGLGSNSATFNGSSSYMLLKATYRG